MKIKVFPVDDGACGRYRMSWPAQALIEQGHDIDLYPTHQGRSGLKVLVNRNAEVTGARHPDCDVLVLQRPTHRYYAQSVPHYQRQGVRVVIEIDDDLAHVPAANHSFMSGHPSVNKDDNFHWLAKACQWADAVVCTTSRLAQTYGGGKAFVVPNYIPRSYQNSRQQHDGERVQVGWAGNLEVHGGDLTDAGHRVGGVLAETGAEFLLVGIDEHLPGVGRELGLGQLPQQATGWFELEDYPKGLSMLDVGLVPLRPGIFNESKSWLKGLEYASVGVPFVASNTEPYRALQALGVGSTARRPKDWARQLRQLIVDQAFREDQAQAAFEAAQQLTVEKNAWRFLEAWTGS